MLRTQPDFCTEDKLESSRSKEIQPVGPKYLQHSCSLLQSFLCPKNMRVRSVLDCSSNEYYRPSTAVRMVAIDSDLQ